MENKAIEQSLEQQFQTLDRYASASYLMHIFALGLINENGLYYEGGHQTFQEYCELRFDYKKRSILRILSVFKRLSPYILNSYEDKCTAVHLPDSSKISDPEDIKTALLKNPLNKVPLGKLDYIIKLSDAKLKNLATKGKVTLGNDQVYTVEEISRMDRNKLKALIAGKALAVPKTEADLTEEDLEFARNARMTAEDLRRLRDGFAYQALCHANNFEEKLQSLDADIYASYQEHVASVMQHWLINVIKARQMFPSEFNVQKK